MQMQPRLPMFRDFVPQWLRFPLFVVLPFLYQCSNPIYMNIASQVMSDTALTNEDVLMCGFAAIIGITVTFPILFRLKFRFTTRSILMMASAGIILCNLVACYCSFMPVLVLVCFLFGIFKVWGTFECMSSMMTLLTPTMHLAPFLSVVFMAVFGGVELGGLASTVISHFYDWHHVSHALTGVHLGIIAMALILMHDVRFQPPMKLLGIDWIGLMLWGVILLSLTAFFVYGEVLDWFHSPAIVVLLAFSLVALGANIWRINYVRHPLIEASCFRYHNLWNIMIIFFISGVMFSSQTVLQNVLTSSILYYEQLNSVQLNWAILAGIVLGCLLGKYGLFSLGWSYKQLTFVTMLFTTLYAAAMYFLVSPSTGLPDLVLPCLFSGIGHSLLFVVLTTYVESHTPFNHRFQMLSVLGLVRTGIASPIGAALYGHLFRIAMRHNMSLLGSDARVGSLFHYSYHEMAQGIVRQAMMASLRQLFGLTVLVGIVTMLIILLSRFAVKPATTLPMFRWFALARREAE